MRRLPAAFLLCALAPSIAACAGSATNKASATQPAESEQQALRSAQTYYFAGEAAYEDGNYGQATSLWKRAVVELPQRAGYDTLRHKLLVRVGHGQLMAFGSTGNLAYLDEGIAMLEAYQARHTELLGDEEQAVSQRAQVYELIGQMEVARDERKPPEAELPELEASNALEEQFIDPHAGEVLGADGLEREVRVRNPNRPDVNDPATRAKLASPFANDLQAGVMTRAGTFAYAPSVMVRLTRQPLPRQGNDARSASRVGRSVVSVGRSVMEECYRDNLGEALEQTSVRVNIDVARDGSVRTAVLAGGTLGTAAGDACLTEALQTVQLAQYDSGEVQASIDLLFFVDIPRPMFEMAVQPFGPFDAGDSPNTMPPTDIASDQWERDYRGTPAPGPLRTNMRRIPTQ